MLASDWSKMETKNVCGLSSISPQADSLNKKVWAQTELWGKSVLDVKIAFFKKSLVLAGTKLSMGLA